MRVRLFRRVVVTAIVALMSLLLAAQTYAAAPEAISVSVPSNATTFTVELSVSIPDAEFSGVEFVMSLSDQSAMRPAVFTAGSMFSAAKPVPTLAPAGAPTPTPAATSGAYSVSPLNNAEDENEYHFGVFDSANNYRAGRHVIGTLRFSDYASQAPQTVTISQMRVIHLVPSENRAEWSAVTTEYGNVAVINVTRSGGPVDPGPGGSGGPGGPGGDPNATPTATPSPTPPAQTGDDDETSGGYVGDLPRQGATLINDEVTPLGVSFYSDHVKYVNGYPDGSVHPDANITRAEAVAIFHRLIDDPEKDDPDASTFNDIPADAWYGTSVAYAASKGIVLGYADGGFHPEDNITRAEFATIMSRFVEGATDDVITFPDVPETHWANEYVSICASNGWISGYPDGTFGPDAPITRAEAVTVLNRALGRGIAIENIPATVPAYTDLPTTHWAYAGIIEASVEHVAAVGPDGEEVWE